MPWAESGLLTMVMASLPVSALLLGCPSLFGSNGSLWLFGLMLAWTCASLPFGMFIGHCVPNED